MHRSLKRLDQAVRYASPWISVGLALALLVVWLRPDASRTQPPSPADTAQQPATNSNTPAPTPSPAPVATALTLAPAPERRGASSYAAAVSAAAPAVVGVSTQSLVRGRDVPSGLPEEFIHLVPETAQRVQGAGSGVIIDTRGYVVTNQHVIANANEVTVQLADGRSARARVVGSDPDTDLAVLKIALQPLPAIELGRSDRLQVGDVVLAIGNPLAMGQTVTQGIVSATGRGQLGLAMFENYVQTDAAINPGNSGGALVDASGRLVAINTAVLRRQDGTEGIGFAIPMNLVRGVVAELIDNGRVARGWLGVGLHDVEAIIPSGGKPAAGDIVRNAAGAPRLRGVAIAGVLPGSPAATAGLGTRDLVLRLDGHRVVDARDLISRLAQRRPGSKARLDGYRYEPTGFRPFAVVVTLGERPQDAQELAVRYPGLVPG
jgi:S1-C subfamily serine protease